jgi:succinate dehydrogenase / fumarate reductase, cytochrome b subunit
MLVREPTRESRRTTANHERCDLESTTPSTASSPSGSTFWGRNEFLIRRLHSLSGLVPVGAYMCIHLLTNATVLDGPETFQGKVDTIHSLGKILPVVEWVFIFLPLIFHAALGIVRAAYCETNAGVYRYGSNVRYTLQRITAWIALFFIAWHVFHMHGWLHNGYWTETVAKPLGGAHFDPNHATSSAAEAFAPLLVKILYAIGVSACVYHLANGIWTSGITWGIWTTPAAQRRADYICIAFGVLFAVVGLGALFGMSRADLADARAVEDLRAEQHEAAAKRQAELEEEHRREPSTKSSSANETAQLPAGNLSGE